MRLLEIRGVQEREKHIKSQKGTEAHSVFKAVDAVS